MIFSGFTTHHYLIGEERLKKNLVEKNMDIENLLRILIHDIANSLSSMTYNLIKAKEDKDKHFPALEMEKIEKALGDINNLLTQVRHLKSVKDGKASLPLKSISLAMVLHEFYENSLTMIQEKGIKVRMDLPDSLYIKTEKTILSGVVLQNILSNAIKFSHAGSFIDIRAYKDDNEAVIEIQDYGIGIPKPILQSLFSVNTHTTRPGTHGEKGTGYGMPLVKEYIHLLGGDIQVESAEPGALSQTNGTKVTLRLPLATN